LMEAMRQMILWKGDTDSVASIAWGILSARRKTEELPAFLYRDLELGNAETGVPYLAKIGRELTDKYWWK